MKETINRSQLLQQVLQDPKLKKIIKDENVPSYIVDRDLNQALAYVLRIKKCASCHGLNECQQITKGYAPHLFYDNIKLEIEYNPCLFQISNLEKLKKQTNLKFIECNMATLNFDDVYINPARQETLSKIKTCLDNYENHLPTKGLYLHGNYGCGKTYLLCYLAKKLADNDHQVIFAYYPGLARMFRSAINDGSLEDLIDELKEIEVLFLDDFGGETLSSYLRDEVLGAILQDRMVNKRLTFMSSNLDEKLLLAHLRESNRDIDDLRASRIFERIATLMDFVKLIDTNYRH